MSKVTAEDYGRPGLFPFISGLTSEAGSMSDYWYVCTLYKAVK